MGNQKPYTVKEWLIGCAVMVGLLIVGSFALLIILPIILPMIELGIKDISKLAKGIFGEYAPWGIIAVIGLFILFWIGKNIEKIVKKK